jgi:hypothetical protein
MATSGNTSWELASTALVNAAYRKLGYISEGQALSTTALAQGVEALNSIVAYLQTKGMPLWKRTTTTVTPSATSQVYTVSAGVKVAQVYINYPQGARWALQEKSLYDFNALPTNAAAAVPVHYTVQPTIADTTVSIWPLTSDTSTIANATLNIVTQKKFDGFFSATDTLDFPSYWTQGIIFKLATALAPEAGLPTADRTLLKAEADEAIAAASDYGDEDGSLYVQPDNMGTWGS